MEEKEKEKEKKNKKDKLYSWIVECVYCLWHLSIACGLRLLLECVYCLWNASIACRMCLLHAGCFYCLWNVSIACGMCLSLISLRDSRRGSEKADMVQMVGIPEESPSLVYCIRQQSRCPVRRPGSRPKSPSPGKCRGWGDHRGYRPKGGSVGLVTDKLLLA